MRERQREPQGKKALDRRGKKVSPALRCRQRRHWVEAEAVAEAEQYLAEESELARRQADKTHDRNPASFSLFLHCFLASLYKAAEGFVNDAPCLAELREACFRQG